MPRVVPPPSDRVHSSSLAARRRASDGKRTPEVRTPSRAAAGGGERREMHPRGDVAVAVVAARQHAVVTTAELVALGIGRRAIAHRVEHRRLTPLHRGVFQVGPAPAPLTSQMAAVLACGPTAVLSHHSAAALLNIRKPTPGPIHVTVTRGHARKRKGLVIHRTRSLRTDEVTTHDGIPSTTAARTLLDIANALSPNHLRRAIEEAQIHGHLDHASLTSAVDRARGHRGVAALRAAAPNEARMTRSEAERRLIELIDRADLPRPRTNVKIAGHEVDLFWPDHDLVVEVDGFAFHGSREAFERDRLRDAELMAAGLRVGRVTWRQIDREPEALVVRLARSLSAGPGPGRPLAAAPAPGFPPRRSRR